MSNERLSKRIFLWADQLGNARRHRTWIHCIREKLAAMDLNVLVQDITGPINTKQAMDTVKEKLHEISSEAWHERVNRVQARRGQGQNKLRTYKLFKENYETEHYV